jgi:hypothetical protein
MFAKLLGHNCVRFEVHRGLAAPGAPPPPFVAAAYFWGDVSGRLRRNLVSAWRRNLRRYGQLHSDAAGARVGRSHLTYRPSPDCDPFSGAELLLCD